MREAEGMKQRWKARETQLDRRRKNRGRREGKDLSEGKMKRNYTRKKEKEIVRLYFPEEEERRRKGRRNRNERNQHTWRGKAGEGSEERREERSITISFLRSAKKQINGYEADQAE